MEYKPITERFESLEPLLAKLRAEANRKNYIYRGQAHRKPRIKWKCLDGSGFIEIEPLLPSDYRFMAKHSETLEIPVSEISQIRNIGRDRRDLFESFIQAVVIRADLNRSQSYLGRCPYPVQGGWVSAAEIYEDRIAENAGLPLLTKELGAKWHNIAIDWMAQLIIDSELENQRLRQEWINLPPDQRTDTALLHLSQTIGARPIREQPLRQILWSLAQHYELSTALLDVTFDADVAAWFASNHWNPQSDPPSEGMGVIYRMDADWLKRYFLWLGDCWNLEDENRGVAPRPRPFLAECRTIPSELALRPKRQQGGSIHGFDHVQLIHELTSVGQIEVFEFSHSSNVPSLRVNRDFLIPPPERDSFLAVVKAFEGLESQKQP